MFLLGIIGGVATFIGQLVYKTLILLTSLAVAALLLGLVFWLDAIRLAQP